LSIDTPRNALIGAIVIEGDAFNLTNNTISKVDIDLNTSSPYFYVNDTNVYTKYSGIKMFNDPKIETIELGVNVKTSDGEFPVK